MMTAQETLDAGSNAELTKMIEKLSAPNGFAKLTPVQRRLLLAAVLSSIVPADGHVRKVEMEQLEKHLKIKFQFAKDQLQTALHLASNQGSFAGVATFGSSGLRWVAGCIVCALAPRRKRSRLLER